MAIDLLNREHSRSENLNSCIATKAVIQKTAAEPLSSIGSAFAASSLCGGPVTILLVEDEAFIRKVTAEVLEWAGYRVVIARSAADALEACRGCFWPLDLILADIVMPGMSGLELATELESFYPHARVLLMSGYVEQLASCKLSPCGKEFLAKPFSIRVLLKRVREVLERPVDSGRAKSH
jgi:two-component system cell cycle sensor histidine kinase/response regulator CckA